MFDPSTHHHGPSSRGPGQAISSVGRPSHPVDADRLDVVSVKFVGFIVIQWDFNGFYSDLMGSCRDFTGFYSDTM